MKINIGSDVMNTLISEAMKMPEVKRIIKDKFFEDMPDPYLKGNKAGNRPHYYCFEDSSTGIYWMIPLTEEYIE